VVAVVAAVIIDANLSSLPEYLSGSTVSDSAGGEIIAWQSSKGIDLQFSFQPK